MIRFNQSTLFWQTLNVSMPFTSSTNIIMPAMPANAEDTEESAHFNSTRSWFQGAPTAIGTSLHFKVDKSWTFQLLVDCNKATKCYHKLKTLKLHVLWNSILRRTHKCTSAYTNRRARNHFRSRRCSEELTPNQTQNFPFFDEPRV